MFIFFLKYWPASMKQKLCDDDDDGQSKFSSAYPICNYDEFLYGPLSSLDKIDNFKSKKSHNKTNIIHLN